MPAENTSTRDQFNETEEGKLFLNIIESINLGERVLDAILPLILASDLGNVNLWRGSEALITEWIETLKTNHKVSIGSYMRILEHVTIMDLDSYVPFERLPKYEKPVWKCEKCERTFKLGRSGQITKPIQNHQNSCGAV